MIESDFIHYRFARLAVDKAKLCSVDTSAKNVAPRVAIVIAVESELIGWCAKGHGGEVLEFGNTRVFTARPNLHAEEALLGQLKGRNLSNATAYVTLEPCTKRKGASSGCADLLVDAGVKCVHVGNVDPNPDVGALAWRKFFEHGVEVRDFAAELRNEALRDNDAFFRKFRVSPYEEDGASFDYENNRGERVLGSPGREFQTSWKSRGYGSIYALDYRFNVALAKNCSTFDQADDPGRWFEDSNYYKPVAEGAIIIFRNDVGFALIKIISVRPKTEIENAEVHFRYQLRYPKDGESPTLS